MGQNISTTTISTKRTIVAIKRNIPQLKIKIEGVDLKNYHFQENDDQQQSVHITRKKGISNLDPLNIDQALRVVLLKTTYKRAKRISVYTQDGELSGLVSLNGNLLSIITKEYLERKGVKMDFPIYGKNACA